MECPDYLNCSCKICSDEEEDIYVTCQWQISDSPSVCYLVYRILLALYFFCTWITILVLRERLVFFTVYDKGGAGTWCFVDNFIVYTTFFGYTCTMLEKSWAAMALTAAYFEFGCLDNFLTSYWVYLTLQTIGQDISLMILMLYVTVYLVVPGSAALKIVTAVMAKVITGAGLDPVAILIYIIYFILNFIDALIVAHTISFWTVYIPVIPVLFIVFCIYMDYLGYSRDCVEGINLFFKMFKNLYEVGEGALTFGMGMVWLIVAHFLFWALHTVRDVIYDKCFN